MDIKNPQQITMKNKKPATKGVDDIEDVLGIKAIETIESLTAVDTIVLADDHSASQKMNVDTLKCFARHELMLIDVRAFYGRVQAERQDLCYRSLWLQVDSPNWNFVE